MSATDQLGHPDRLGDIGRVGFTVRVQFRAGDHDFWGWRRSEAGALRLARSYSASFRGCGIAGMQVVAMTYVQWRAHARMARCRSGDCPRPAGWPGAGLSGLGLSGWGRPGWGEGRGTGCLLPVLVPPATVPAGRQDLW